MNVHRLTPIQLSIVAKNEAQGWASLGAINFDTVKFTDRRLMPTSLLRSFTCGSLQRKDANEPSTNEKDGKFLRGHDCIYGNLRLIDG
jgi:hypothetical protein